MSRKKSESPEPFSCPVEKMAYLTPFRLTPNAHEVWIIIDYWDQSITADGELCRDKPIKVRSNTGVNRDLPWGTIVYPTKENIPQIEVPSAQEEIEG